MREIVKKSLIMNDYIVHEDLCNFKCEYCLGKELTDEYKSIINTNESNLTKKQFTDDIVEMLDIYEQYVDADILQVSGGEIFLINDIIELFKNKASNYKKIYVLTNGYPLNEDIIVNLSKIPNLVIGLSLDGHTLEMNSYRFKSEVIQSKILHNLDLLIKHSIPVVVNSVLHKRNIKSYKDFLYFLSEKSKDICVLPISVRGNSASNFSISETDIEVLLQISQDKEIEKRLNIIPVYFEEMYRLLKTGKKSTGCWVPLLATEMFNTGEIMPCPLYWLSDIGNIKNSNPEQVFDKIGNDRIYNLLVRKPVKIPFCQKCFSSYDLINLYFENRIESNIFEKVPFFNDKYIIEKISKLRGVYIGDK